MKFETNFSANRKLLSGVILMAILLLAAGLRFYKIGAHGLAGDEKYSMYVAHFVVIEGGKEPNAIKDSVYFTPKQFWDDIKPHHFFEAIARLDTGNGAFYTLSLRVWMSIFGNSDAAARSLSAVFNLFTIVLIYGFVHEFFKNRTLALLAAFLSAVSPFFIAFSQVARNYAMLFFFALAATYLLLRIIRKQQANPQFVGEVLLYGLCALICLLCHISTATLFVVHGIYILLYFRKQKVLLPLLASAVIPVVGMALWLTSAGGKWMFEYVANSVNTYNYLAQNSPEEFLQVATAANVFNQMQYVVSCLFITSEGLYRELSGLKNGLVAVLVAFLLIVNHTFVKNKRWQLGIAVAILGMAFVFFSVAKWHFLIFVGNIFLLFYLVTSGIRLPAWLPIQIKIWRLVVLIPCMGLLFLVFFASMDGNTFRLMPRYVGYIYPFTIVFVSLLVYKIYQNYDLKFGWLLVLGLLQLVSIAGVIRDIYRDNPPRYFMNFYEPRQVNPYRELADTLVKRVVAGDTVVYPSFSQRLYGGRDEASHSIADAQLINIYLPQHATIIQRIDHNEPNKVMLKHADGSQEMLFDFEGATYRY